MNEPVGHWSMDEDDAAWAKPFALADLVRELVADAEATLAAAAAGRPRGPRLGLPTLDAFLGQALEPGLHNLTGDPGSGKTALALQAAASCEFPALVVTGEQSAKVLFRRHIGRITKTPDAELKAAVPMRIRELAEQAAAAAPMLTILDATRHPAPKEQIAALAGALRKRFKATSALIVVDSLQCWSRGVRVGDEYACIQAALADLVSIAYELASPVIVLSHRNRAAAGAKEDKAGMVSAKGSADFEHLADTVLHLTPQGKADPCSDEPREVSCFIAKNRNGPAGFSLPLYFDGRTQTFSDRAPGVPW
jgi:replicative DNA helicase